MLGLVEVGIGDEQHEIGPLGRFAGHFAARAAADLVDARRIDEDDLRFAQARQRVAGAVPGDVPDFARPAAADIDAGHVAADEGVDQALLPVLISPKMTISTRPLVSLSCICRRPASSARRRAFSSSRALPHAVERLLDGGQGPAGRSRCRRARGRESGEQESGVSGQTGALKATMYSVLSTEYLVLRQLRSGILVCIARTMFAVGWLLGWSPHWPYLGRTLPAEQSSRRPSCGRRSKNRCRCSCKARLAIARIAPALPATSRDRRFSR